MKYVDETNFSEIVLNNKGTILVDFCADWCGPCMKLKPILEEISSSRAGYNIASINVDNSPNIVRKYAVDAIPTLIIFKSGKAIDRHTGFITKENIQSLMDKYT
ncbi:MAG: thioredoxin [Clostridia bacterium]|nr:thioredoxin [Clostridia bacterium]